MSNFFSSTFRTFRASPSSSLKLSLVGEKVDLALETSLPSNKAWLIHIFRRLVQLLKIQLSLK
jgi:hypothetical protein